MSDRPPYDTLIKNVRLVRPNAQGVDTLDLAIREGRFAHIAPDIDPGQGARIIDGGNLLGFPGLVDAHMHVGIYHELEEDADSHWLHVLQVKILCYAFFPPRKKFTIFKSCL